MSQPPRVPKPSARGGASSGNNKNPKTNLITTPSSLASHSPLFRPTPQKLKQPSLDPSKQPATAPKTPATTSNVNKNKDDQIEIVDYSEDATTRALFAIPIDENDVDDDITGTLSPEVPSISEIVDFLHISYHSSQSQNITSSSPTANYFESSMNLQQHQCPGGPGAAHHLKLNDIFGQVPKTVKINTSEALNSYQPHNSHKIDSTNQIITANSSRIQNATINVPSNPNNIRTLSSFEGVSSPNALHSSVTQRHGSTLTGNAIKVSNISATTSTAFARQQNSAMSSIGLTNDGVYLASPGMSDAIADHIYTELAVGLGTEFVQYVQHTATLPIDEIMASFQQQVGGNVDRPVSDDTSGPLSAQVHVVGGSPAPSGMRDNIIPEDTESSGVYTEDLSHTHSVRSTSSSHIDTIIEEEETEPEPLPRAGSPSSFLLEGGSSSPLSLPHPRPTSCVELNTITEDDEISAIPPLNHQYSSSEVIFPEQDPFGTPIGFESTPGDTFDNFPLDERNFDQNVSDDPFSSPNPFDMNDGPLPPPPPPTVHLPSTSPTTTTQSLSNHTLHNSNNVPNVVNINVLNTTTNNLSDQNVQVIPSTQYPYTASSNFPGNSNNSHGIIGNYNNIDRPKKKHAISRKKRIIDLSAKPLITPSTVGNCHDTSILISTVSQKINKRSKINGKDLYQQPTFQPLPAPVGSPISETKNHNNILYIDNCDEPMSKTTFAQITFLDSVWPHMTRYFICFLTGSIIAFTVYMLETWIGSMVRLLYWVMSSILQFDGNLVEWPIHGFILYPVLTIFAAWALVVVYWLIGITFVFWGGMTAVRGSGLPALNAYFDGSYDQNVPLFGVNVMIAKLISVALSLGGLLKGGLQGPLIHFGAVMGRGVLKGTLLLVNTTISHRLMVYLCCCCFDRRGHARKLRVFPWQKQSKKHLSYIQSDMEIVESLNNADDDATGTDTDRESTSKSESGQKLKKFKNTLGYAEQIDSDEYSYTDDSTDTSENEDSETYGQKKGKKRRVDSTDDYNLNMEKELMQYNNNTLSPLQIGKNHDVQEEMTHRIHVFAHGGKLEYSDYTNPDKYQTYIQSGYDDHGPEELVDTMEVQSHIVSSPSSLQGSSQQRLHQLHQQQQQPKPQTPLDDERFQYHSSSVLATAAQHPFALKGNDYKHIESLTLSKRIELICDSLSGYGDEHDILSCGAVAGFTCAFNAPIAGIIMIQSMLKQHSMALSLRLFFTALVSVVASNLLRSVGDTIPDRGFVDLVIPPVHAMTSYELYFCILFGAFGGIIGVGVIKLIKTFNRWAAAFIKGKYIQTAQFTILLALITLVPGIILSVVTSCTPIHEESFPLCQDYPSRCLQLACPPGHFSQFGSLLFANPERLVRLTWDRSAVLANEFNIYILLAFSAIYVLLAALSALSVFPGGFFIPAIAVGGLYGRLLARVINYVIDPSSTVITLQVGVYATLGSVAMLVSINRLTLPTIAMMVEFTSDVQFLTPMMIVLLSSKFVADYCCLGLEPEVAKLNPRATMAMGELQNHFLGHVTAKDVMTINASLEGYPAHYMPGEIYPGQTDLAVVGEIDSVHRLRALLDTTSHSAYPIVSVLPSHLVKCEHTAHLSSRIYQRNLLKSICSQYESVKLPTNLSSLQNDLSVVGRSLSMMPSSKSAFRGSVVGTNAYTNATAGNYHGDSLTITSPNSPQLSANLQGLIHVLQSHHDDEYARCKCQLMNKGHGKFLGLITRRNLRKLVERSVDYTRAIRLVASGHASERIWAKRIKNGKVIKLPLGKLNNKYLTKVATKVANNVQKFGKKTRTTNTVDTAAGGGGLVDNTAAVVAQTPHVSSTTSTEQQQQQHMSTCTCFSCLMKHWTLIRFHTPILALLQHHDSKKRLLPIIANIYYQTALYLKNIYKQQHPLNAVVSSPQVTTPTTQQALLSSSSSLGVAFAPSQHLSGQFHSSLSTLSTTHNIEHLPTIPSLTNIFAQVVAASNPGQIAPHDNHFLALCHPVLLHRELLSTAVNYVASSLITLPPLPYHLRTTIAQISREKEEQIAQNMINSPTSTVNKDGSLTTTLTEPIINTSNHIQEQTTQQKSWFYTFSQWVKWLEERSRVRHSLNKDHSSAVNTNAPTSTSTSQTLTKVTPSMSKTTLAVQQQQHPQSHITPSKLCVSLVNTLSLVDTGVYIASCNTSGSRLWRSFRAIGMSKIVIVDEQHHPVGIITRKDMVRADKYLTSQMNGLKTKLKQQ